MGREHASREKKFTMVNFLIFVQINIYIKGFQKMKMGRSKKVKIWPRMGLAYVHFWLRSLLEAPKWVKDSGNGPQMIPPTAPD